MRPHILLVLLALAFPVRAEKTVTLLHFSDYHSHALPFYNGEEGERGGLAHAVAYLKKEKARDALVFSGGDTMNAGSPAWSDRYQCAEWPWLNGVVDAMAFGNHDADYGRAAFDICQSQTEYPILSANTRGFRQYVIYDVDGVLVGVFGLAGGDFSRLVKGDGFVFSDPVEAARGVVQKLKAEGVDAIVLIGHQHTEDDFALAKAVPGIDLIFGSHSHIKREPMLIPGTQTWFVSSGQYLESIARAELTFDGGRITRTRAELIPVTARLGEDRTLGRRIRGMQRQLANDPKYRELFEPVGKLAEPLPLPKLAERTLEAMRAAAGADVALSTVSSFRQPLPAGTITGEQLRASLPYDNEIVVCTMSGAQWQRVVDESAKRDGSDSEAFLTKLPAVDPAKTYKVATTEYLANAAYKEVLGCTPEKTGRRVREELQRSMR